jgi:phospholipid/cholesterol/gamma-HCH transport system substrate-binding protein
MRVRGYRPLVVTMVVLLVAALAVALFPRHGGKVRVTARFSRTVSVYPGSEVRVLGIPVGKVTEVTPEGTDVRVALEYDRRYKVPADAKAVIISPSVVADRHVQLTPVYRGGAVLADGAEIPRDRTATPVELDRIFDALNQLDLALGPKGANRGGALSRVLDTTARNLQGNGDQLHQTVKDVSKAASTLARNQDNLFGTVRNLQAFVTTLAANDRQVRTFNTQLATVSAQLAGERDELDAALENLAVALAKVTAFVRDNRTRLSGDLKGLADVTGILARQQRALEEVLDVAPTALSNLHDAYNPSSGTLDTRIDPEQLSDPGLYLCSLLRSVGQRPDCKALQAAFKKLPPLPLADASSGLLPSGAKPDSFGDQSYDTSLGGILGGRA